MRRSRQVMVRLLPAVLVVLAGACASSGAPRQTRASLERAQTLQYWRQIRDSVTAQAIADEQGPRVTVRAEFSVLSDSRRVRAHLSLEDDAYVMIGHLDPTGVVRVMFPNAPDDDGFLRGDRSYQTREMFAGFESEFAWHRAFNFRYAGHLQSQYDSYDGSGGFVFVVASWRPMRLDRIADGDEWTSFELVDFELARDPRPAIEELAALIAGDNREAYTVAYAKYFRSNFGQLSMASLNRSYCSGFGYGFSSWGWGYGLGFPFMSYGAFGSRYGQCGNWGSLAWGYGPYMPGWGGTPVAMPVMPRSRLRPPDAMVPKPKATAEKPSAIDGGAGQRGAAEGNRRALLTGDRVAPPRPTPQGSDEYRRRGLIVTDAPATDAPRRAAPRMEPPTRLERPGIVDMVGRREASPEPRAGGRAYERPRNAREAIRADGSRPPRGEATGSGYTPPRSVGGSEGRRSAPSPSDGGRMSSPPRSSGGERSPSPRASGGERPSPPSSASPRPTPAAPASSSPASTGTSSKPTPEP